MAILTRQQVRQYASQVGFSGQALDIMVAICQAESSFNTDAIGPVGEIGLAQIYPAAHPQYSTTRLHEPLYNLQAAHDIYVGWGNSFRAWTTYTNGAYKKFLTSSDSTSTTFINIPLINNGVSVINNAANQAHTALNNVPGIAGLAIALDDLEQFTPYNPTPQNTSSNVDISMATFNKLPHPNISLCSGNDCDCLYWSDYGAWSQCKLQVAANPNGVSVGISTTASQTVQAVIQFITGNTVAFIIRALITLVGLLLLYALVLNLTSSITKDAVEEAAPIAEAAALL